MYRVSYRIAKCPNPTPQFKTQKCNKSSVIIPTKGVSKYFQIVFLWSWGIKYPKANILKSLFRINFWFENVLTQMSNAKVFQGFYFCFISGKKYNIFCINDCKVSVESSVKEKVLMNRVASWKDKTARSCQHSHFEILSNVYSWTVSLQFKFL